MKTQTWYVGIGTNSAIIAKRAFDNYQSCYEFYEKILDSFEWFGFDSAPMFWCEVK